MTTHFSSDTHKLLLIPSPLGDWLDRLSVAIVYKTGKFLFFSSVWGGAGRYSGASAKLLLLLWRSSDSSFFLSAMPFIQVLILGAASC